MAYMWETTPLKYAMTFGQFFELLRFPGKSMLGWPKILLCLELEQIRDHFYYTNDPHLYSKSGLGFALTQSIAKFL